MILDKTQSPPPGRPSRLYGCRIRAVLTHHGYFRRRLLDLRPAFFPPIGAVFMGKGDMKSRRGKIYRGSFGKSRPKDPVKKKVAAVKALKK